MGGYWRRWRIKVPRRKLQKMTKRRCKTIYNVRGVAETGLVTVSTPRGRAAYCSSQLEVALSHTYSRFVAWDRQGPVVQKLLRSRRDARLVLQKQENLSEQKMLMRLRQKILRIQKVKNEKRKKPVPISAGCRLERTETTENVCQSILRDARCFRISGRAQQSTVPRKRHLQLRSRL
jgi:hypothetical protein